MMRTAWRFARREMRGGLKGFRILTACLALGVAAIAASGSLKAAFHQALAEDARALLGGDLELRQSYLPLTVEQNAVLARYGKVSIVADMRANAHTKESSRLVELKGVDAAYPLAGQLLLQPAMPLADLLDRSGDSWGAAADPSLLDSLGLELGQSVQIGAIRYQIRALIQREPDRVAGALSFGPRLLVAQDSLHETGLLLPGSLIRWASRLSLAPGMTAEAVKTQLAADFPHAAWHLRDVGDAAPGLGRLLDNLSAFLTLVGLTALLAGGIGIANSVKAYMDGRRESIAILKALGAPQSQIFAIYGLIVGLMSLLGTLIGAALGGGAALGIAVFAGDALPAQLRSGFYPAPLLVAAAYGLATALPFAVWPLGAAVQTPAAALLRRGGDQFGRRPSKTIMAAAVLGAIALAVLAVAAADRRDIAAVFVAAALAVLGLFRLWAWALSRLAAALSGRRRGIWAKPWGRLALAGLHRPGSNVVGLMLSLGLGLTVLTALAVVEGNLARQFGTTLPAQAPSFYFIDLQPGQSPDFFNALHKAAPQAKIDMAPMVRGRITHINGRAINAGDVAPQAQWALRGDRGLTVSAQPPKGAVIQQGHWWPADYAGPPLVSVDGGLAEGLGLHVGDSIGFNILGRETAAEVASLRQVDWAGLNMNFAFILSPGALAGAPFTSIAAVHVPAELDAAAERAVSAALPNVSAIRVKEALLQVRAMIDAADAAVRLAAAVTLAAGALVVAGAVAAGRKRREREAVILKVLGATRSLLWKAWAVEFGLVGLAAGSAAALFGSVSAWAILVHVMHADWTLLPGTVAATIGICVAAGLAAGFAGTYTALRAQTAAYLRDQ